MRRVTAAVLVLLAAVLAWGVSIAVVRLRMKPAPRAEVEFTELGEKGLCRYRERVFPGTRLYSANQHLDKHDAGGGGSGSTGVPDGPLARLIPWLATSRGDGAFSLDPGDSRVEVGETYLIKEGAPLIIREVHGADGSVDFAFFAVTSFDAAEPLWQDFLSVTTTATPAR